ncbi:alpha/beta hydrolase [Clostridium estertheticum]|uniref:alpha/beta hydrolase n=1 Tax=Clostridium estertheticum TaxID=238834 RepID=UPI001C6EF433|nr:alpha/beta hydrolase [Clostridium estertheticum]MBW9172775.1 alpha/beta hydrolase [Clostridium estertheticum]WLC77759.1 alpha/beta hydrolase [Clostridium estertheticum]
MLKQNLKIKNIPAILWGDKSDKIFVVVHGNMSNKADDAIVVFAEEVTVLGYQVLSFDLPEHGERNDENYSCKVQNCVRDLNAIMHYAKSLSNNISLFACSMGVYFSLLAYSQDQLKQCLFLSPVVNMERIINNMMTWFSVTENRLKTEKEVSTPIGQTLYWDYYCYVKEHPIVAWNNPTSILYGSEDNLCEFDVVAAFAKRFNFELQVMEQGEHYFHTEEQLQFFRQWLKKHINVNFF